MKQRASRRPFSEPFCWGGDDIGFLVLAKALIIGREPGLWFLGLEQGEWIQLHMHLMNVKGTISLLYITMMDARFKSLHCCI